MNTLAVNKKIIIDTLLESFFPNKKLRPKVEKESVSL